MDGRMTSARLPFVDLVALLLLSVVCGCADVRIVRELPDGGILAMPMNNDCWPMYYRRRAARLMSQKCPEGYRIEREEFVWDGKPGPEGHRARESYFGYTDPHDEMAPYLRKEYWITFHAASSRGRQSATKALPKLDPSNSSASPPSSEGKDELPPPRPLRESNKTD